MGILGDVSSCNMDDGVKSTNGYFAASSATVSCHRRPISFRVPKGSRRAVLTKWRINLRSSIHSSVVDGKAPFFSLA